MPMMVMCQLFGNTLGTQNTEQDFSKVLEYCRHYLRLHMIILKFNEAEINGFHVLSRAGQSRHLGLQTAFIS